MAASSSRSALPLLAAPPPARPRGARRSHVAATVSEVRRLVETTLMTYAEVAQRTGVPGRTVHHWASTRKWTRPSPLVPARPRGPRRSHIAATVSEVRHLVETTLMTYAEIAQRTGVLRTTVWKWSKTRNWTRPGFAPRFTHTVPTWRAGRARKRRLLALRVAGLAERYLRALEAAAAPDAPKLREARALLAMAKRTMQTPRQRLLAVVRPVAEGKPRAGGKAVARKARRAPAAAPAVAGVIADARPDRPARPPHPAAIRRKDVRLSQRK